MITDDKTINYINPLNIYDYPWLSEDKNDMRKLYKSDKYNLGKWIFFWKNKIKWILENREGII